jgi:hypothetical protein
VALFNEQRIPTERPPRVGDVSANFWGWMGVVVSAADPYGRILGLLDRNHYSFSQPAPRLYSGGWVDPVPDPFSENVLAPAIEPGTLYL